jgi:hypothetical protein
VDRTQRLQGIAWEVRRSKTLALGRFDVALQAHHAIGDPKPHGETAPGHQWTNPETWPSHDGRFNWLGLIHQKKI